MERKELIAQMKSYTNAGFISKKQLASFMGYKSVNSVGKYLATITKIDDRYFIPEVADAILRGAQN